MKKTFLLLPCCVVLLLSACTITKSKTVSTTLSSPISGEFGQVVPIPLKDFDVKGIITVKSQVTYDKAGNKSGSEITHEMLLKEAAKLGADDIINVRLDQTEDLRALNHYNIMPNKQKMDPLYRETISRTITYTATALAIKYTQAILPPADARAVPPPAQANNAPIKLH